MHIQLSLSLHFYLLYLLLTICDGNDATPATWSSASLKTGKQAFYEEGYNLHFATQTCIMEISHDTKLPRTFISFL